MNNDKKEHDVAVESADELLERAAAQPLPFSVEKQMAVLGHLMANETFWKGAYSSVTEQWWSDVLCAQIWGIARAVAKRKGNAMPTVAEVMNSLEMSQLDSGAQNRLRLKIELCVREASEYSVTGLRAEMTFWIKSQLFKSFSASALRTFNNSHGKSYDVAWDVFQRAVDLWRQGVQEVDKASFEVGSAVDFNDYADGSVFIRQEEEVDGAITFGNPQVDRLLYPKAPSGALMRGDQTVILAPVNIGKSTCLTSVANANVRRGNVDILYITHEGRVDDIKSKLMRGHTRLDEGQLQRLAETPEGREKLAYAARSLGEKINYLPINRPGLTVEDVAAAIDRAFEERVARTGKGYDLIVDDYPAKLTTQEAKRGRLTRRDKDETVYNYFTQIALHYNCHVLTAVQTNREASKINRHTKGAENRLLTLEDVAESFGVTATATNVISLNRDMDAEQSHRITFHLCKTRTNEKGWSVVSRTRYDLALTHAMFLASTYYRGLSTMSDSIDGLLEQFANVAIPDHYYYTS